MIFHRTKIDGVWILEPQRHEDERGFFARTWCRREFEAHGLDPNLAQCSISSNQRKGTLRGMHYQVAPHAEAKVVSVTRGAIHDVAVDLRPASDTFRRWLGVELTAENRKMLYIPEGVAHGFQTVADDTDVMYHITQFYHPDAGRGIRWDDPAFGIAWPLPEPTLSERDRSWPDFSTRQAKE